MNCKKCNTQINDNSSFCPSCGTPVGVTICKNCNTQVSENSSFCPSCGAKIGVQTCKACNAPLDKNSSFCPCCGTPVVAPESSSPYVQTSSDSSNQSIFSAFINMESHNLPAFILGLIGSIFGLFGGICTTICSSFFSSGVAPMLLIFGGSVVGLIGACFCLKKALLGSSLQLIGALMIIICAYGLTGSDFMTIIGMLLLIAGGLVGFIPSIIDFVKKQKNKK